MHQINLTLNVTAQQLEHFLNALAVQPEIASISVPAVPETTTASTDAMAVVAAPNAAAGHAIDKRGIPWIEAVHAGSKALNKDGTWKRRRGVDAAVAEQVEKEALGQVQTAAPAPAPAPADPPDAGPIPEALRRTPEPAPAPAPAPAASGMPGMPGMTAAMPEPISNTPPAPISYADLIAKFEALSNGGMITMEQVQALYAECGVTDPAELTTNETLRAKLFEGFSRFEG